MSETPNKSNTVNPYNIPINAGNVFDENFIYAISLGKNTVEKLSEKTQNNSIYVGGYNQIFEETVSKFVPEQILHTKLEPNPNLLNAAIGDPTYVILPNNVKIKLEDIITKNVIPYNRFMKQRLINAAETDQVYHTCLNILTGYALDEQRKALIKPIQIDKSQNEDDFKKIINDIIEPDIQKWLQEFIDSADRSSRVWEDFVPMCFKNSLVLGTSGFFTELVNLEPIINDDLELNVPLGSPSVCKSIHPYFFEKIYYDRMRLKPVYLEYSDRNYKLIDDKIINTSWKNLKFDDVSPEENIRDPEKLNAALQNSDFKYVEDIKGYKQLIMKSPTERQQDNDDRLKGKNTNLLLPMAQCVLFRHGLPVAPNVEGFGVSRLFSTLEISEVNREIHYDILPSLNKLQMRGAGIVVAPNIKSETKLKALETQLEQGANYIITATPITYVPINISLNGQFLSEQRTANARHILMGVNVPSPFMNFEAETNRDTMRIIGEFFKDTSLQPLQKMVRDAMRDQWYYRLVEFFFKYVLPLKHKANVSKKDIGKNYSFINLKLQIHTEFGKINFAVYEELIKALNDCLFLTDAEKREEIGRSPLTAKDQRIKDKTKMQENINQVDKVDKRIVASKVTIEQGNKEKGEIKKQNTDNQRK